MELKSTMKRKTYLIFGITSMYLVFLYLSAQELQLPEVIDLKEVAIRARGPLMHADDTDLIQLLRVRYLDPPSQKPYSLSTDAIYLREYQRGDWKTIKRTLRKLFEHKKPGFFIEAGALDGQYLSNTLYLEQVLGWTGLLVEPNAVSYRELQKKNRHAWSSNTCLSVHPYPHQNILVQSDKVYEYGKLIRWMVRGSSHLEGYNFVREEDREKYKSDFVNKKLFEDTYAWVQCFPVLTYLMALNVTHVGVFSLDVQGAEKEILYDFPWRKITVDVFIIEYIHLSPDPTWTADIFQEFMTKKGYMIYARKDYDYIFVHRNFSVA